MRIEIEGKSVGSGAFADGFVVGQDLDYIEKSKTGNHWTRIYKDVPDDSVIIEYGYSRGGRPWRTVRMANGLEISPEIMKVIEQFSIWKEYES